MGTVVNVRGDWPARPFSDSFEPMESNRLLSKFSFVGRSGTVTWNNVRVLSFSPNALKCVTARSTGSWSWSWWYTEASYDIR